MKQLIITPLLLLFVFPVNAQEPPKPPSIQDRLKRTNEIILKEVGTSAEQLASIEKYYTAYFVQADKIRKDNPPPPIDPKVKTAMDKIENDRDESIYKVLTTDQYKKYQAILLKLNSPKPGMGRPGMPPPPPPPPPGY